MTATAPLTYLSYAIDLPYHTPLTYPIVRTEWIKTTCDPAIIRRKCQAWERLTVI